MEQTRDLNVLNLVSHFSTMLTVSLLHKESLLYTLLLINGFHIHGFMQCSRIIPLHHGNEFPIHAIFASVCAIILEITLFISY